MNDRYPKGRNSSSNVFSSEADDNDCNNEDLSVEREEDSKRIAVPFAIPKLTK